MNGITASYSAWESREKAFCEAERAHLLPWGCATALDGGQTTERSRLTIGARRDSGPVSVLVLDLAGELDLYTLPKLRQALDLALDSEVRAVVLNVSGLTHVDSSSISFFVTMQTTFAREGRSLRLAHLSWRVWELLNLARAYHLVNSYPTVEEAVRSLPLALARRVR